LVRVEGRGAIVAGISYTVPVRGAVSVKIFTVLLVCVGDGRAVVLVVQDTVSIDVIVTFVSLTVRIHVPLRGILHVNTVVARISDPVAVVIRLVVRDLVAVVAAVPEIVFVRVQLERIEHLFTVVLLVGHAVPVDICGIDTGILVLVRIGQPGTIVTRIADAVRILVLLKRIVRVRAVVTRISNAVVERGLAVGLVLVAHKGAVVFYVRHPVTVEIILCERETGLRE